MNTWHELVDDIIKYNKIVGQKGHTIFLRNIESNEIRHLYDPFFVKNYYHQQGKYIRGMPGDMYELAINKHSNKQRHTDEIITPELLVRMLLEQS